MPADQGEGPNPAQYELTKPNALGEQDPFLNDFWHKFIETASVIPQGYDTVTWPIHMIDELKIRIADTRASRLYPEAPPPRHNLVGEKLEPYHESFERIQTAFRIVGYNYVKDQPKGVFSWHVASTLRNQLDD